MTLIEFPVCLYLAEEDMEVISTMEKLCSKVTEMETQRQSLVASLRSQLEDDDVTSALMTNPGIDAEVLAYSLLIYKVLLDDSLPNKGREERFIAL